MKFSIIIPTYNNLKYLKLLLYSLKKNSFYKHQVILHVNDGSDGTLSFVKKRKIDFTYSPTNIGLCSSLNIAAKLVKTNYILYAHDDMFFCNNWDIFLENEVNKLNSNLFYLTGTNVSNGKGLINFNCGSRPDNFDEIKFNNFCQNNNTNNYRGSHWAPHLIHRDIWKKVGGFSEEFNPGDGSDPDFCMKLWNENVRIFKAVSKFKVYHFSSATTRKRNIKLNKGTKLFTLKYGFNPKFFRKYYLQGDKLTEYKGPLKNPKFKFDMIINYFLNKLKYIYYKLNF